MLLIFLVFCVVLLWVFTFWVPCCDVHYDFRIKTMFGSSLPPVVCRRAHVLFTLFVFVLHSSVQHILCCVYVLFLFVLGHYVASFSGLSFLAHLTQRVRWAIAITWHPSSSSVVRHKLFQKSSPLKVLDQPTWPLLLKIEHMVKLQVLGNSSKTVNQSKIWQGKNDQHSKIYLPCNFEVYLITHLGVIALFSSNFVNFNTFRLIFQKL